MSKVENTPEDAHWYLEWAIHEDYTPESTVKLYYETFEGQCPQWFKSVDIDTALTRYARVQWPDAIKRRCTDPKMFILTGKNIYTDNDQPYADRFFDSYPFDRKRILNIVGKLPLFFKLSLSDDLTLKAFIITDGQRYRGPYSDVVPFDFQAFNTMIQPPAFKPETFLSYVEYRNRTGKKKAPQLEGRMHLGM